MCSYVRPQNTLWTLLGRIGAQSHICEFQHLRGGGVSRNRTPVDTKALLDIFAWFAPQLSICWLTSFLLSSFSMVPTYIEIFMDC